MDKGHLREMLSGNDLSIKKEAVKTFDPVGDQVSIRVNREGRTEAGLSLPDGSLDPKRTPTGRVLAVGPKCQQVKEGDVVIVHGSTPVIRIFHGDSAMVVVCHEEHLIGVSCLEQDKQ